MSTYAVIIERADSGSYGAWSPDLPGCVAVADTQEAAVTELREAIRLHLAGLRQHGHPAPQPTAVAATVITLDTT